MQLHASFLRRLLVYGLPSLPAAFPLAVPGFLQSLGEGLSLQVHGPTNA
jgi:hypothetical protein